MEIDRDADRRWMYASMKARVAEAEDKEVSDSAPFEDAYKFSKDTAEKVHDFISKANSASSAPKELKGEIDKMLKENPPSDDFKVRFPRVLHERLAQKALALAQEPACFRCWAWGDVFCRCLPVCWLANSAQIFRSYPFS